MAQTFQLGSCLVEVREPVPSPRRTLILLPGWNYSRTAWCEKSTICAEALRRGYRLLLLEMGKSIYATRAFPETRSDWRSYPTLRTLLDTVFPELRRRALMHPKRTFLLGLSTGGRGVVLILAHTGNTFTAGASLSGDFDPHLDSRDPLLTGWYGRYSQRWDEVDNPMRLAEKIKSPLFLAHGVADNIVSYQHSQRLYLRLKEVNPTLPCVLHLDPRGKHDFAFWEKYGKLALDFFEQYD
ncbi:MAG: prolyl oligopeptidase family serine peptidase [Bacteroidia bacterium]|nr:prolyl oligopeptidase family serine peptidase [Bacteroidia bacterium]MCX7651438.1 prolyl oligopeptidase family serine peptidase [Bacteroidia bacterium]MDW8417073.1 prolyl oligopeptidase family serine peptidase [Bacteroidia bacterium]